MEEMLNENLHETSAAEEEGLTKEEIEKLVEEDFETFSEKPEEPKKKRKKKSHIGADKSRITVFTGILLVFLLVYIIMLLGLMFWAVLTSLKGQLFDYDYNKFSFPKKWITTNYEAIFKSFSIIVTRNGAQHKVKVPEMFLYSVLYAGGCAFMATLVPCIVAYLCARFKYKFSKVIHTIVIVTMILPIVGALPSEVKLAKAFGLYNQIWGLWIMKGNFLGMYFLVFYAIFKGVPMAYTEAAKIDGAGNLTIFVNVILPLVKTTFFTVMLITFINFWNDYQIPEIYLPNYPTISQGMAQLLFNGASLGNGTLNAKNATVQMAGSFIILVPILTVFLVFQKRLLGNLTMGGIKG